MRHSHDQGVGARHLASKGTGKGKAGQCAGVRCPGCALWCPWDRPDTDPWAWTVTGAEVGGRVRHRPQSMAECKALHVVALPCSRQQNIRRQDFIIANATIFKSRCGPVAIGSCHDWSERHGTRSILPSAFVTGRKAESGDSDSPEDRCPVLQHSALWDDIQRPRCRCV